MKIARMAILLALAASLSVSTAVAIPQSILPKHSYYGCCNSSISGRTYFIRTIRSDDDAQKAGLLPHESRATLSVSGSKWRSEHENVNSTMTLHTSQRSGNTVLPAASKQSTVPQSQWTASWDTLINVANIVLSTLVNLLHFWF